MAAILDSTQFNQLVQEVREALLAGSQGVGEVEIVKSLDNIVSLPALRLIGQSETVVEAPLTLLSLPAVDAAADARKATEDAIVAAVNASAAADLSEAERKDLADIKEQTIKSGTDAAAKGDKAFAGAMNAENATLYALQVASYLQTKLEQAQVVVLSGKAVQDVIEALDSRVRDNITVCVETREAAYAAILQLRELQLQVAQAIVDAYLQLNCMTLTAADVRQAVADAVREIERIRDLSERTERVIIESVIQTGEARLVALRLEALEKDLLFSKSAADTATRLAHEQADRAMQSADEASDATQKALEATAATQAATEQAQQATKDAIAAKAATDKAAADATQQARHAEQAGDTILKTKAEADIAAARALAAEQRAIEAAKTAENIVSGIRPNYNEPDKTNPNYIANKPEIPTLESAPTAGTLTYTNRDGNEVAFRVGDEVRVLEDEEYTFYKLYDLAEDEAGNPVASWDEAGSGSRLKTNVYLTGADHLAPNIIEQGFLKQG